MSTLLRAISVIFGLLLLGGCQSAGSSLSPACDPFQGPFESAGPVHAFKLMPTIPHARFTRATVNDDPPGLWTNELLSLGDHQWALLFGPDWEILLKSDEAVGWRVLREMDEGFQAFLTYEPGLLLLPTTLTMDQPVEQSGQVEVRQPLTGRLLNHGEYHITHQLLGRRTISLPHRTYDTVIVESDRKLDLKWATVRVRTQTAYAPRLGPVLTRIQQTIRLLGLIPITTRYQLERMSDGDQP